MRISGKYGVADVYATVCESSALDQINGLLGQPFAEGSHIAVMPDVHAGKGCVIGLTMNVVGKRACPDLVGCDIGCGVDAFRIPSFAVGEFEDFPTVDRIVRDSVSDGCANDDDAERLLADGGCDIRQLLCVKDIDLGKAYRSLGTLGRGNHFVEIDREDDSLSRRMLRLLADASDERSRWLVVHTGSRGLGMAVFCHYLKEARSQHPEVPMDFAYCSDDLFDMYIHDLRITQRYASVNRDVLLRKIVGRVDGKKMDGWEGNTLWDFGREKEGGFIESVHNYIGDDSILRKGAVSARQGERLVVPMNMRDGAFICEGKGNPDYNFSAPHGAGRVLSRTKAKAQVSLDDYRKSMDGIYSSCVSEGTKDESAFAYKPIRAVRGMMDATVSVKARLRPLYNYKAS